MQSSKSSQSSPARKISVPVSVNTRRISEPAMPSTSVYTSTSGSTSLTPTSLSTSTGSSNNLMRTPLVMTPISQLSRGPRRHSRGDAPFGDRPLNWDPEHFNPDGSLRTIHKLPSFEEAYAAALNTRYIRHKGRTSIEKELSVNEIFQKDRLQ